MKSSVRIRILPFGNLLTCFLHVIFSSRSQSQSHLSLLRFPLNSTPPSLARLLLIVCGKPSIHITCRTKEAHLPTYVHTYPFFQSPLRLLQTSNFPRRYSFSQQTIMANRSECNMHRSSSSSAPLLNCQPIKPTTFFHFGTEVMPPSLE